ncbi:MAG: alanine racemase [Ignavibacteria bacterium]|nr:alanine racemase [Ignavibacteria bacterium]
MRSTIAEIDTVKLRHNFHHIRSLAPGDAIMPMVKANAYGHGIVECSRILSAEGAEFLGVAFASEGVLLRENGISVPIVVMTPPEQNEASDFCEYNLQAVACSLESMKLLSNEAVAQNKTLQYHLYIDTGLSRDGILPDEALDFMNAASTFTNCEAIGICTHFATSDESDTTFSETQLKSFNQVINRLKHSGYEFEFIHAANTAGIAHLPEAKFSLVRPGISMYGCAPTYELEAMLTLEPILTLKTAVLSLRRLPTGTSVSYGRRYYTDRISTIVTIPIGYGDGYMRALTGKAECLIQGKRYPIVGTICMDECMVDIGDDEISCGDEVILIGKQGDECITVGQIAEKCDTIPYEILTAISARVPRVYT